MNDLPNEIILIILEKCSDFAAIQIMSTCHRYREFIYLHSMQSIYDIFIIICFKKFKFTKCHYTGPKSISLDYILPKTIEYIKLIYDPLFKIPEWIKTVYFDFAPITLDLSEVNVSNVILNIRKKSNFALDVHCININEHIKHLTLESNYINVENSNWKLNTLTINSREIISLKSVKCEVLIMNTSVLHDNFEVDFNALVLHGIPQYSFLEKLKIKKIKYITIKVNKNLEITEFNPIITNDFIYNIYKKYCIN